jgi:D-glycero-alpha-D-manno-heptose-7-phosphate kinase
MQAQIVDFTLGPDHNLLDAIRVIESHRIQTAFIVDDQGVLIGLLTNGDVRRFLLDGGKTSQTVMDCANRTFRAVPLSASKEELLKLFDLGFAAIPRTDDKGRLVDFVTADFLPTTEEVQVVARARAPARISFAGGGTDLTYYFYERDGAVLNAAITLYSTATLTPKLVPSIDIYSQDTGKHEHYGSLRELLDSPNKGLLSSVVAVLRPAFGFELFVHSDFPVGSGLGGSSAVATAVIAVFNELRIDRWSPYEVAELAFHAERLYFGVAGGWQDQYASAFGGFNLIEFGSKENFVNTIRVAPDVVNELEECLILCHTGVDRNSGKLHEQQRDEFHKQKRDEHFEMLIELSRRMHRYLMRGELKDFGNCLNEAWNLKIQMSPNVSNQKINEIYAAALSAGALGGKLLGAGDGGFFLVFVETLHRRSVTEALQKLGIEMKSVRFEQKGAYSWRTRTT